MTFDEVNNVSDSISNIIDYYQYPIPSECQRCRSYKDCFGNGNPFELKIQMREQYEKKGN